MKKHFTKLMITGLLAIMLLAMLAGCTAAPAPVATEDPVATPEALATEEPVAATEEPVVEVTAEPTAEPTPEPTPKPTPEPTPEPTEKPAEESKVITISKQPGGENAYVGDTKKFIVKADGAETYEWYFVNEDANDKDSPYAWNAEKIAELFPKLVVEDGDTDTLTLRNMPIELNHWSVVCKMVDGKGDYLFSDEAHIHVSYAPAPEATPKTQATPAPTAKPQPTPTPTQKPAETPKPTAKPQETPKPTTAPTHNHDWKESGRVAATCETAGSVTYTCSCGQTKTETLAALGHEWRDACVPYQVATETHTFCRGCGMDLTAAGIVGDAVSGHCIEHQKAGGDGSWYTDGVPVYDGYYHADECIRCGKLTNGHQSYVPCS